MYLKGFASLPPPPAPPPLLPFSFGFWGSGGPRGRKSGKERHFLIFARISLDFGVVLGDFPRFFCGCWCICVVFPYVFLWVLGLKGPRGRKSVKERHFLIFVRFPGIFLGFSWDCPGIVLGLSWDCPGIFLGFSWDSPGIFLGFS